MWRMECEESLHLLPELTNSLSLIVSGMSEEEIVKGWENLRNLEESGLLQGSVNLEDAQSIMRSILQGSILNLHQVPKLMAYFAKYVKKKIDRPVDECEFIINDYVAFVQMTSGKDITLLASMVEILKDHPVYRSSSSGNAKACKAIVVSLGSFPMPKLPDEICCFRENVLRVKESLRAICKCSNGFGNSDLMTVCLETVYAMISDTERERNPGPGLISILELVESRFIRQAVKWIIAESQNDDRLESALKVLCSWVPMWLRVDQLSKWIMEFITSLELDKKYDILNRVAGSCLKSFLTCIIFPMSCFHATLLSTTILYKQASHELFHRMIKDRTLHKIFTKLGMQISDDSMRCVQTLVNVVKGLMERFPGYEFYESLEKSFPLVPQMECVMAFRYMHVWSVDYEKFSNREVAQYVQNQMGCTPLDHGKVGLTNLGNTCYMNSVLQALAMTRQFSQEVMRHKSSLGGDDKADNTAWVASAEEAASVMPKLQNLFALLSYSRRRSLSPTEILAASRPEYFTPGQQQDSSEFLCHLLDVLYEQEKSAIRRSTAVAECTVGSSAKGKRSSDVTLPDRGVIKRWTTEEDLSEGISLERKTSQSLGDFPQAGEDEEQLGQTQPGELLSDCHSDSTDSGIQSVDGGGSGVCSEESTAAQSILVHRVFGGESKITYQCAQCDTSSHNTDRFRDLQLCFPQEIADNQEVSVQDLMNYYLTPEKLTGENKYRCDKCTKLCDAQRIIKILRAPIHLIMTLKHFHYDTETRLRTKLRHKVIYNETIQLPVSSNNSVSSSSPIAETYRLYAAVVHSGYSMDYGHYITYARDSKKNWYKFNDSYVSRTNLEDFNALEPPDTPYILFYEKISTNDKELCNNGDDEDTKTELSTLSKHIQDLVERDARAYEEEMRHQADKKRSQRNSPSGRIVAPSLRRHDNSDDENPPPSSCRGPIDIPANRFLF